MNESLGSPTKRIFPASNLGVTQGFSGFTETRLVVSDPKWPHHHDHTSSPKKKKTVTEQNNEQLVPNRAKAEGKVITS